MVRESKRENIVKENDGGGVGREINKPISPRSSSIIRVIVFIPIKNATKIKKIGKTAAIESILVAES